VILDHHPSFGPGHSREISLSSGVKNLRDMRAIGYFRSDEQPTLPDPHDFVDPSWDPAERDAVIDWLRKGEIAITWCGTAMCRFDCAVDPDAPGVARLRASVPDEDVGRLARIVFSREFMGANCLSDGTFIWPEGFPHYLEVHAVRPPEAFVKHVLSRR